MLRLLIRFFTTGFFTGNLPLAPGTFGSLFGLLLILLFPWLTDIWWIIILFLLGVYAANYEDSKTGVKDDPRIVIDEIVGILITFLGVELGLWQLLLGFILFRVFDILKPSLIRKVQELPAGWGVMVDDLLAGITAQLILRLIMFLV